MASFQGCRWFSQAQMVCHESLSEQTVSISTGSGDWIKEEEVQGIKA
jgi:hypothetical protein